MTLIILPLTFLSEKENVHIVGSNYAIGYIFEHSCSVWVIISRCVYEAVLLYEILNFKASGFLLNFEVGSGDVAAEAPAAETDSPTRKKAERKGSSSIICPRKEKCHFHFEIDKY
jgi:hypothetical protein